MALLPLAMYAGAPAVERIDSAAAPILSVPSLPLANPAVRQWRQSVDISEAYGGYAHSAYDGNRDPQRGGGERAFSFGADSYMKYKSSTLWGAASYENGKQLDVRYNETADIDLVYPYVAADTIGGDINLERYSFNGGYADRRGRWSWGGALSYTAGLYYRNVDPRPRNVTGLLDIKAGVGYTMFGVTDLSAGVSLRRYTQTNDIDFKSQMGVEKIYHLTGLGHHYSRFAGLGLNAHYGGYRYGASLSLFPRGRRGLFAAVEVSRFTLDKVLRDLNELPMASVAHNELSAQIGWLHPSATTDWAVAANFNTYRRRGTENIFGDASSNIYPQIASLDMYADNCYSFRLSGLYSRKIGVIRLWASPEVGHTHRRQLYRLPASERLEEYKNAALRMGMTSLLGKWWIGAAARYACCEDFGNTAAVALDVSRAVSSEVAVSLRGGYSRYRKCDSFNVGAAVVF